MPKPSADPDSVAIRPHPTVHFKPYSYKNTQGMIAATGNKISLSKIETDPVSMKKVGDFKITYEAVGIENFGSKFIIYGRHQFTLVDVETSQIEEKTGLY